jgi:3-methyladenine DNA glycosylase AlkC
MNTKKVYIRKELAEKIEVAAKKHQQLNLKAYKQHKAEATRRLRRFPKIKRSEKNTI